MQLGWVRFVYDDNGQLIGEYDERGNALRLYVWLEHMPIAMLDRSGVHYLHTDHLHTPTVATDEGGTVSWHVHTTPFGEVTETVTQIEMNLRFPGQYHDRETGLHQNWHREYAPHLGRYTQSDPIGLEGGFNVFSYALENPIVNTDRTGKTPGYLLDYVRCLLDPDQIDCSGRLLDDYLEETVDDAQTAAPIVAEQIAQSAATCATCVVRCSVSSYIGADLEELTIGVTTSYMKVRADQTFNAFAETARNPLVRRGLRRAIPGVTAVELLRDTGNALDCVRTCD